MHSIESLVATRLTLVDKEIEVLIAQ